MKFPSFLPILALKITKQYNYASKKSAWRLPVGTIRQSLSNQSPGRSPGQSHLCVWISGKTQIRQEKIGNLRELAQFPIFVPSLYQSYRPSWYSDRLPPLQEREVLFRKRIQRPYFSRHFRPKSLHIGILV